MKGLKCNNSLLKTLLSWLFLPCLLVSSLLLASSSVSAISYGKSSTIYLITSNSWATVPGSNPVVPFASGDALVYTIPNNGTVTDFSFGLERALSNNTHIISFTLNFNFGQSSQALYRSPQWQAGVTLFDSCVGGMNPSGSYVKTSFSCHYTVLITGAIYQLRTVPNLTWISNVPTSSGGNLEITVSPISSITLVNSDLSSSDIQQLSSNITSALEDLEISVEGSAGATPEQIQEATVSAIEQTQESEKQQIQDASDSSSDSAESAGQQSEAQMTTLLGAFSAFVNTVSSIEPTNCLIDMDVGYFNYRNIDLCQLWTPPQWVSVIASITMIGIMVPLSISAAKKFIQLVRSFTG